MNDEPITKLTRIIKRVNGSEIKLCGTAYYGQGLKLSKGVDLFHRETPGHEWRLCCDKQHPYWEQMRGEILKVSNALGRPLSQFDENKVNFGFG